MSKKITEFVFGLPGKREAARLAKRFFPDGVPEVKGVVLRGAKQVAK